MPMEFNRWTFFGSLFESVVARQINTLPKALELIESSQFTQYSREQLASHLTERTAIPQAVSAPASPDGEIDTPSS